MSKVYICGNTSDLEKSKETFRAREDVLIDFGYIPVNPIKLDAHLEKIHARKPFFEQFLKERISALLTCNYISVINEEDLDEFSSYELIMARKCGIKQLDISTCKTWRQINEEG